MIHQGGASGGGGPVSAPDTSGSNISTNATTLIKTGAGFLNSITFNKKGASANVMTVYDGVDAGGVVLAIIDTTDKVSTLAYNIPFTTGLCIVTATGTACDATVSWI